MEVLLGRTSFCLSLLLLLSIEICKTQESSQTSTSFPAVIVFGDSIVDPGNNNNLQTIIKANYPPYGRDFLNNISTGRFCNGKIPTDFIVSKLGIKEFLPAYLDPMVTPEDLLTGVSFASSASGYDYLTSRLLSVISLEGQLQMHQEYIEKLEKNAGKDAAMNVVSKGLYIVCAGSDDLANTYFNTPFRRMEYEIESYIDFLVTSASSFYQELVQIGVRKIAIVGIPPIGCLPMQRTLHGGVQRLCMELYNQAAIKMNNQLFTEIQRLGDLFPRTRFVFMDIYSVLTDFIQNPSSYGFQEVTKGCCGTGKVEVTSILCNRLSSNTCSNASNYLFWDSYHPTEKAYEIIVDGLFEKYLQYLN